MLVTSVFMDVGSGIGSCGGVCGGLASNGDGDIRSLSLDLLARSPCVWLDSR